MITHPHEINNRVSDLQHPRTNGLPEHHPGREQGHPTVRDQGGALPGERHAHHSQCIHQR